jgi:uncharacterized RmlC-like cupin family protein
MRTAKARPLRIGREGEGGGGVEPGRETSDDTTRGRIRVIRADQLKSPPEAQTAGMTRRLAVSTDEAVVGLVRTAPDMVSGWHHHGEYETYAYVVSGTGTFEFGPNGQETIDAGPGDFIHIPAQVVHRESNPGQADSLMVLFRMGHGEPLFNVEGPLDE